MPDTYGTVQYSTDNKTWQTSNVFNNLKANTEYTVYVKYSGNATYAESEVGSTETATNPATYTISIPSSATVGGDAVEIKVNGSQSFDLGYEGKVDVNISSGITDGKLTLTRVGDTTTTITSALLVNESAFTNTLIAEFKSKEDSSVSLKFEKPIEANIPAGTYSGTVNFEISYTQ